MQTLKHVGCWIANTQFRKPIALGHGMSENLKNLVMAHGRYGKELLSELILIETWVSPSSAWQKLQNIALNCPNFYVFSY